MQSKALKTGISLHRGPFREPRGCSLTRDFEKQIKEGSGNGASLSVGALWGNLEGGLLYWGPRRIWWVRLWKRSSFSIRAPFWGRWRGCPFPRDLTEKGEIFLSGNFLGGIRETLEEGSGYWQLSLKGPRWGTWRGVLLRGTLKYRNTWALFLDSDDVRSLGLGTICTFSKGPGLPLTLHQSMGHKGLSTGLVALGPKVLKLNYYSTLLYSNAWDMTYETQ